MRVWSCAGHVFAVLLPSQTLPSLLEAPHIFLWCQYKKTYGKKYNHHPDSEERDLH